MPARFGPGAVAILLLALFTSAHAITPIPSPTLPDSIYRSVSFENNEKPDFELFQRALTGYYRLKEKDMLSGRELITIIDFRKASSQRRLWVIDLSTKKVKFHSLVAHGRNSGELYPTRFSNTINSYQSSLGFYVTGKTYQGKHGLSLKLHGVERGINDQAETRAIVMHGADYASEAFIGSVGRLGRSLGCPAVPMEIHEALIREIAEGTCLFIYYPDDRYLRLTALNYPPVPSTQVSAETAGKRN